MNKKSSCSAAFVLLVSTLACVAPAVAQPDVVQRDTTGFPAPGPGMARLVIVRERQLRQDPKPEFVFVDRTPVGVILPKTGVTAIVPAGMHKVWLGRGLNVATWVNAAADGRYLLRMREVIANGTWYADFVMDSPEGYAEFATANGFKLAVSGPGSMGSLERNLEKVKNDTKADSLARLRAIARATTPIQIRDAWYRDLDSPPTDPMEYEHHSGKLVLDDTALGHGGGGDPAQRHHQRSLWRYQGRPAERLDQDRLHGERRRPGGGIHVHDERLGDGALQPAVPGAGEAEAVTHALIYRR
jgi:hypothetical protein